MLTYIAKVCSDIELTLYGLPTSVGTVADFQPNMHSIETKIEKQKEWTVCTH
jgi:hypothetical protein